MSKAGVLLVNLGTPDSPNTPDVRRYLREFLMDERVIDIPGWRRWLLVNMIIAPLRAPKSAAEYKKLWDKDTGSPLYHYGKELTKAIRSELGDDFVVELAMRYQNPPIEKGLKALKAAGVDQILVVPLFPQYAEASTGSVIAKVNDLKQEINGLPPVSFVDWFYQEDFFTDAFAAIGKKYLDEYPYDHVLFSYHGLPERQILKGNYENCCRLEAADCAVKSSSCQQCYRFASFDTSRILAEKLGLREDQYTVCFQSRLGKTPWIKPYTDEVIETLSEKGIKSVLAYSPAFIADCLETTLEVGEEYRELFEEHGGEKWQLVESLNLHPIWVQGLKSLIIRETSSVEA